MTPSAKVLPTTPYRIAIGKAHPQQKQFRILRDVTPIESAEFGFLPVLLPVIGGLFTGGAQVYGQIKGAESQEKAATAAAEAAVKIAEAKAASRADAWRKLAPVLALTVVGGTLVTVIMLKRKKARTT